MLHGKVAVIHGGSGAIGSSVAKVFVREGARVFLAARGRERLERVAAQLEVAADAVDALDEAAVEAHLESVRARAGRIDVVVNAIGIEHTQGTPVTELSWEAFDRPVSGYVRVNFLVARAAARHLGEGGVLLTFSTPGSRMSGPGFLGNGVSSAAVEAMARILAGELGPRGVRVVCLRPNAIPGGIDRSHTGALFTSEALSALAGGTLLGRLPTLEQVAEFTAFAASDRASAYTGAIANLSCGALVD